MPLKCHLEVGRIENSCIEVEYSNVLLHKAAAVSGVCAVSIGVRSTAVVSADSIIQPLLTFFIISYKIKPQSIVFILLSFVTFLFLLGGN